jgi:hypothetical protein
MGAGQSRQAAKERPRHTSKPRANQVHSRHNAEYFEPVGVCDGHEGNAFALRCPYSRRRGVDAATNGNVHHGASI